MDLQPRREALNVAPGWMDDTALLQHVVGGITLDATKFVVGADGKKIAPSGIPVGMLGTGKYRMAVSTTLAAAALAGDTHIDVAEGFGIVPGDVLSVKGTNVTVALAGVIMGGGTGGSNRVALTAAIGAGKNAGDTVANTDGSEVARAIQWRKADLTRGDQIVGAIDHGYVREAALPAKHSAAHKAALRGITYR